MNSHPGSQVREPKLREVIMGSKKEGGGATHTFFYLLIFCTWYKTQKVFFKNAVKNIPPMPVPSHCVSVPKIAFSYTDCMCTQIHTHTSLL